MGEVVYAPQFGGRPARPERVTTHARVLIVDRDAATLAAISQALQNEGHWTATAFDASAAIATAERLGPFDLLIVDVDSADGLDVAETLRRRDLSLQVLCVTSRRENVANPLLPAADEDTTLQKPFSESELVDAVTSLLYWRTPRGKR
jgi:DNA-binding response OmpR family regulator